MDTYMQLDEFMNNFLDFEEKYEMFKLKINNVHIWYYLRFFVYYDLIEKKKYATYGKVLTHKNIKNKKTLDYMWRKYVSCNQFLAHKKDVLIVSHGRKYKADDKYYKCPYTHLLDEYLSISHYILDGKTPDGNYEIQKSHNILYYDIEEFKKIKRVRFSEEVVSKIEVLNKVIVPIEVYFEINISLELKKKWMTLIKSFINGRKILIRYYNYMLKKVRPKIILVVCAYGFDQMIMCEVAHKMCIPVVELQHGIINSEHIAYNFKRRRYVSSFPDYIFTFGQYEKEQTRFPISKSHIIPIGYPELENNYNIYKKKKSNKKNILFISQTMPEIAKFANIVAQKIDSNKYQIVFQLHPSEYSCWRLTVGQYLKHPNIKVIGSYKHMIYESLAQADWVVGNYSTVLSEAQMFDVKVAVLKLDMYRAARFLYQNGYAILVESPEQLIKEIEEDTFQPNREVSLFEKNSLKKMQEGIDKIIEINEKYRSVNV